MEQIICAQCKEETDDFFMLTNDLWKTITKPEEEFLCIPCTEKRLGRKITPADLNPDAPVNYTKGLLDLETAPLEMRIRIVSIDLDFAVSDLQVVNKKIGELMDERRELDNEISQLITTWSNLEDLRTGRLRNADGTTPTPQEIVDWSMSGAPEETPDEDITADSE